MSRTYLLLGASTSKTEVLGDFVESLAQFRIEIALFFVFEHIRILKCVMVVFTLSTLEF